MDREMKFQNVVVISDSDDDDYAGAGDRRRMKLSEDVADDLGQTSEDDDQSDVSSFHPSSNESELSESDEDLDDDRDYHQSEDDNRDDDESGSSPSLDGATPGEDDDSLCKRVIKLLQEKRDIGNLCLKVYKAYLRKQGLRISGTKAECLMRIHEHWRIKDDKGEYLYPRSSFAINCTGDVCKGDVVLFRQRVYQKYEKLTRSGKVQGSRTIAGRVVKESYGMAKQQHTFTVEVLWSMGAKKLPPLFPLLIKGRNLYRLKTFRQPWKNEAERLKALDEKHKRGAIARQKRDVRLQGRRMHKSKHASDKGQRHQKHQTTSNHTRDSQTIRLERGRHDDQREKNSYSANAPHSYSANAPNKGTMNEATRARRFKPAIRHKNVTCNINKASPAESYPEAPHEKFRGLQLQSDRRNAPFAYPGGHVYTRPSSVGHYGFHSHYRPPGSYSYSSERLPWTMPLPPGTHMHPKGGTFNRSTDTRM